MVTITGKEVLTISNILKALNEAFPPAAIPTRKYIDGELKNVNVQLDPYFVAYKQSDIVWLACVNYDIWHQAYDYMQQFCLYITQEFKIKAHPCHQHPVSLAMYKRMHHQKQVFFIGKVSWS
jgi:hypothetical protein